MVEYEGELFPGMIVIKSSDGGEVSVLHRSGENGLDKRTNFLRQSGH